MITGDLGGNVRVFAIDCGSLVDAAEGLLTRDLTDDECCTYLFTDGCGIP